MNYVWSFQKHLLFTQSWPPFYLAKEVNFAPGHSPFSPSSSPGLISTLICGPASFSVPQLTYMYIFLNQTS